jgi:hypothetical protein
MVATIHLVTALLVAASAVAVVAVAVVGRVARRDVRFALDRAILAGLLLTAIGIALGLVILATGGRPADPLHLLYAVVALAILPVARFWDRLAGHRLLSVGIGGLILAGLVVRLFQTG